MIEPTDSDRGMIKQLREMMNGSDKYGSWFDDHLVTMLAAAREEGEAVGRAWDTSERREAIFAAGYENGRAEERERCAQLLRELADSATAAEHSTDRDHWGRLYRAIEEAENYLSRHASDTAK